MVLYVGLLLLTVALPSVDCGFDNAPHTTSFHENYEDQLDIWTVSATCNVRYTISYTCYSSTRDFCIDWDLTCYRQTSATCNQHAYTDVSCNECVISSDASGHFEMDGFTVRKKQCSDSLCGPTCSADGCLNGGDSYSVSVTCRQTTGYETDGLITHTFTVSVTNAAGPSFYYADTTAIDVDHDVKGVGSVINTMVASYIDTSDDYDYIRYVQNSGPETSYIHNTADLFYLDTSTGEVKVGKSLTLEFSYDFTMHLCVKDRRDRTDCDTLSITLYACFQTPNCSDRTITNLHDTFGTYTGHGGASDVFLQMSFPQPSGHFTAFSTSWQGLTWTFDSNEFPEAAIDLNSGDIYVTSNISIWPAWPTKEYHQTVRVANSASCYTTTCAMYIVVHYTNWPISIISLPTTRRLHEDTDAETVIHRVRTYDYNYDTEDNVTCYMTDHSPDEANLFELKDNGRNEYNSYRIVKLVCQTPDCGYKGESFLCAQDIGCLNHNLTQQYTVTIQCYDAYNTTDTQVLTFIVRKNQVPAYLNLAGHIDLDRNTVSHLDILFSILYQDNEGERLYYEYTYEDLDTGLDPGYFLGTSSGNYFNDLGNITATVFLSDKEVNKTYRIHICGHERRNEICEDLTIDIEEYCGESPGCSDASIDVTTEFTIGDELFDIYDLRTGPLLGVPYKGLSYAITSSEGALFQVDSNGVVTTSDALTTNFPTSLQKTYTLVGFIYDQGACSYGTCSLVVNVIAVNYALQMDNLPATVWIHEDTLDTDTLFTVTTSDDNDDDTYECSIVNNLDVDPFYLERVPPVTGFYEFKNRDNYPLSTATLTYTATITCEDSQGEGDTQELEVEVIENEAPVLANLGTPTSQNMDPMDYVKGDTAYTVQSTDTEGDDLIYSCTIDTNFNPFECYQESGWDYVLIRFRRNVHMYHDDGEVESVDVCVSDPKHTDASCGTLEVTFTRIRTAPEITNLPDTVNVAEDAAIGDTIFTPAINDPDTGETHIVSMAVDHSSHTNKFQLDPLTGILSLGSQLNYENINYYEITFDVRDEYLDALAEKILAINVTNVNEGNTITTDVISVTFYENMTVNTDFEDLGISCTDIDGDETTIDITPGVDSDHFKFNQITNRFTLIEEFDYEVDATSVLLTLTCSDGEFDSSVVISMSIMDVNDNQPSLVATFGDINVAVAINPSTPLSERLVSVSATDADVGNNDEFEFSVAGKGVAYRYFRVVATSSSEADLKLKRIPNFRNDKSFPITVLACDNFGGSGDVCGGITFTVNYTAGDPDAKNKEATKCLTCTSSGRVFIALLAVECAIIFLFIVHFIYSCFCRRNKVVKLADFNKSRNTTFKTTIFSNPSVPLSRRNPLQTTVKPSATRKEQRKQQRKQTSRNDVSSSESSSSSSSSSSDDDDRITRMSQRKDVRRPRFASVGLPPPIPATATTGLPQPVYSSRASGSFPSPFRR